MPRGSPSSVPYADADYGSFTICADCGRQVDIWTERCDCGSDLLPDDRHVKLTKSGGSPGARMEKRAARLEADSSAASLDQAVRDRAALRAQRDDRGRPEGAHTPRIVRDLISLERLDEACREAEGLAAADIPETGTYGPLATELVKRGDPRAEWWLRRTIELDADASFIDRAGCDALELKELLVGMLIEQGRVDAALPLYEGALADLETRRKKSAKSLGVALTGASGEAFAAGRWGGLTQALDAHRKPLIDANVAAAVALAREALAEKDRLERAGELAAARQVAFDGEERADAMRERLHALAAGLKPGDRRVVDQLTEVARLLAAEYKRLKKAAKRS